jgi:LysR family transcriptional regulator, regulator for bpeEF and oprC
MTELFTGVIPFVHVAEASSFRRAAEQLGVSTAAVSKAVAALEDRVGVKLLSRTSRAVALTPEGRAFLERCREAVASVQAGRDQLAGARGQPRGEVRVSSSFILAGVVVEGLPLLAARFPELRVRLSLSDRLAGMPADDVDVALRVGARTSSTLKSRVLLRPRWVTVVAPAVVGRLGAPSTPADLAKHNCLRFMGTGGKPAPWWFAGADGEPQLKDVEGNFVVDQGEKLLDAAIGGAGVAQVLDFMAAPALRDGTLVEVLSRYGCAGPLIHAVTTPERGRAPAVRAFVDFVAARFAALGA